MQVQRLELRNFTSHEGTVLDFPERGVVLVTGPNGAGKSSLVDGVAWGAWGETLRGTPPTDKGGVTLRAGGLLVERSRKGGSPKLSWWREGEGGAPRYESNTKAQAALEAVVGGFERWRRTHVFSSSDAALFTLAGDKERKLFLEGMLGVDFDGALGRCRADLQGASRKLTAAESDASMARVRAEGAGKRLADARAAGASLGAQVDVAALRARLEGVRRHAAAARAEVDELVARQARAQAGGGQGQEELRAQRRRLADLQEGFCAVCGQEIPAEMVSSMQHRISELSRQVAEAQGKAQAEAAECAELLAEARELHRRLQERAERLAGELSAAERLERARAGAQAAVEEAQAAVEEERAKEVKALESAEVARREVCVLEAAELALGLRGVRSQVLARLLGGLEASANAWLPRLAGAGLRLELKPYSERKTGGVADAISLKVHGAGGGHGYKAASGGERRRIDVALLLAFAGEGTLFVDEVFDALDAEGAAAVAGVLGELSRERCVVVVTHSEELASRLPGAARWRVREGRVEVC